MVKKYHKLVRDLIPEIIEASGKTCTIEVLSDEDYLKMVDAKLDEELAEYHKDQNIEELADLLEVIRAAAIARGYTVEELEQVRAAKALKRGGFEKRLLLKDVSAPNAQSSVLQAILCNKKTILASIEPKMLKTYCWLEDNLYTRNISSDAEYRKKFSGYYRMRFVTPEYRDAFFELFEKIKYRSDISFEEVSRILFAVDHKHEFSFISKMLHTINPSLPIYDSQVDATLNIHRSYQPDFSKRTRIDAQILNSIKAQYQRLLDTPEMAEVLEDFDRIAPNYIISTEKKLDFILWALGKKNA